MKNGQIITVKEFRKIVGKEADSFSDDEIRDYINELDFLAELFIEMQLKNKEVDDETRS